LPRPDNARPDINIAADKHYKLIVTGPERGALERYNGILTIGAAVAVAGTAPEAGHDIGKLFLQIYQVGEDSRVHGNFIAHRIDFSPRRHAHGDWDAVYAAHYRNRPDGQLSCRFRYETDYEQGAKQERPHAPYLLIPKYQ
jgi:hypothetical protein